MLKLFDDILHDPAVGLLLGLPIALFVCMILLFTLSDVLVALVTGRAPEADFEVTDEDEEPARPAKRHRPEPGSQPQ